MTIKEQITKLFSAHHELTVKEIVDKLSVTKQSVHSVLNGMVERRELEKTGKAPKTIYRNVKPSKVSAASEIDILTKEQSEFLKKNFLLISETGKFLEGELGFENWCRQRKLPFEKTVKEFITTKNKYNSYYRSDGLIDGMEKLKNTKGYEAIHLDELYYLDFYAIERFGKTRLGTLLHYAKQGQNKYLMKIMVDEIKERVIQFVKKNSIEAVGYISPTIRREVQIMKYFQTHFELTLPRLEIKKISGIIPVPQKSLSKLEERISNAQNTFAVTDRRSFKKVLLIDDAVGSGATINEIAGKLKQKEVAKKVIGLAVVGSFKGFDVITDV